MFDPHSSTSSVKHHSETHIIKTVCETNKELNGDQKPEHKKTINRAMMGPTTDIDSQAPNIWNRLRREHF